ncbi:hypothetical protein GCK72_013183 [Caenorhabditis remanei]|uniref:Uncharacterized protein n=1 Tax=Caenorhabditis remanei TaxID=31234 RepID=A0A6A5GQI3_CAERE|nr:hypothetical protein GCK72_013183 [Caenorhabditis remanei]KAF1756729.1 hypothetical protein GCK72_013183 [Caenorhabditis remanei]
MQAWLSVCEGWKAGHGDWIVELSPDQRHVPERQASESGADGIFIPSLDVPERPTSKSVADSTGRGVSGRGVPSKAKELAFRGEPLSEIFPGPDDFSPILILDAPDRPASKVGTFRSAPSPDVPERQASESGADGIFIPPMDVPERPTSKSGKFESALFNECKLQSVVKRGIHQDHLVERIRKPAVLDRICVELGEYGLQIVKRQVTAMIALSNAVVTRIVGSPAFVVVTIEITMMKARDFYTILKYGVYAFFPRRIMMIMSDTTNSSFWRFKTVIDVSSCLLRDIRCNL